MPVLGTIYLTIEFLPRLLPITYRLKVTYRALYKRILICESLTNNIYQYFEQNAEALHFCLIRSDRNVSTRCFRKGTSHCSFHRALQNSHIGRVSLINFVTTWNNLLRHCISPEFLLIKGDLQGAVRKELNNASYIDLFKTATGKVLLITFINTANKVPKHCIFVMFLLIEA